MQIFSKIHLFLIILLLQNLSSNAEITNALNNKINKFAYNSINNRANFLINTAKFDYSSIKSSDFEVSQNSLTNIFVTENFDLFVNNINSDIDSTTNEGVIESEKSKINDSSNFVPYNEFFYADQPRYTFNGNPALINTKIKPWNAAAVLGAYSVIFYVQHSMQQSTIWKKVGPFHIVEDIQYSLGVDKCGHFFGGYSTSYTLSEMLQLSGLSWDAATIWGSVLGLSYMSYVEILDGFSQDFGFSPSDFYADVAGAAFFSLQHYIPVLQNFSPKFEYVNPVWLGEYDRKPHDTFIDNYSAQTFWLSVNIRNLFGGVIKEYCPKWINLSIGYAVYSLSGLKEENGVWDYYYPESISHRVNSSTGGNRKIIIALDYDLAKLLPDGPPFWNWMKQSLNLFKLPAPAIEFGFEGKTKVYLLYPFEFRLSGLRF